jgi:hypothetical protein
MDDLVMTASDAANINATECLSDRSDFDEWIRSVVEVLERRVGTSLAQDRSARGKPIHGDEQAPARGARTAAL